MTHTTRSIIENLKLLIDFSCENQDHGDVFELFHNMLIRMSYKAVDVLIEYEHKRVFMCVLAEDESYDAESVNQFAEKMAINFAYTDLKTFLLSCLQQDIECIKLYYPFLLSSFSKKSVQTLQILESA